MTDAVIDYVDLMRQFPKTDAEGVGLVQAKYSLKEKAKALGLTVLLARSKYMPPLERAIYLHWHKKELSKLPRKLKRRYQKNNWDWFRRREQFAPIQLPQTTTSSEVALATMNKALSYARGDFTERFIKPMLDQYTAFAPTAVDGMRPGQAIHVFGAFKGRPVDQAQLMITLEENADQILSRLHDQLSEEPTTTPFPVPDELAPDETVNVVEEDDHE